ncbi:MAG: hypothetical protein WBE37_05740 [Bryobacteraceae bacterium]
MLRLRSSLALAVLLAPVIARGQSEPALWRFVYPNAQSVISIDWARIRQSQAGALIREKWLKSNDAPAIPGMELLNDIDRVLISSPAKSPGDSADASILIALHGHFDAAQVHQLFALYGTKPQSYNAFQVYRPQGKDATNTAWVLFDAETILYGDAPSVFSALDRSRFSSPPLETGSVVARATELDANYEFWMILDAAEMLSNDRIAALVRGGDWGAEAQGFEAGVNLRDGLEADITVHFPSDDTAKRVTTELTRTINQAVRDKSTNAQVQDIARKLKFTLDGSTTKISLRLNEQDLEKGAQAFAAGLKAGERAAGKANPAAVANAAQPEPVPSAPKMIRIEGLDNGPVEIPYPDPQQ